MKNATLEHDIIIECKKTYLQQSECLFEVQPSDGRGFALRPEEERGLLGETLLLLLLPPSGAGFGVPSPFLFLLHRAGGRCGRRIQAEGGCLTSGAENGSCGGLSRLYIDVSFSWPLTCATPKRGRKDGPKSKVTLLLIMRLILPQRQRLRVWLAVLHAWARKTETKRLLRHSMCPPARITWTKSLFPSKPMLKARVQRSSHKEFFLGEGQKS